MALSPIEDRYLSALTALEFPDMPVEPEQPLAPTAGMDGMQLAAGPSRTMSDAGGGVAEIKPIPRSTFQTAVGKLGELIQSGAEKIDFDVVGLPGVGTLTLKDLTVGDLGKVLQDMSYGFMPVRGGNAATGGIGTYGMKADPAFELLNAAPVIGAAGKAGIKAAKALPQMIGKAMTPKGAKLTPNIEVPAAGDITKPAFKKWFGESQVTNDAGQPIVVYHARSGDFGEFDTAGRGKTKGTGAFFSSSADVASTYAVKGEENIVPVYLSMKKPVIIDANGANWSDIDMSAKISVPEIKVSDIEEQKLMAELTGSAVDESAMKTIPAAEMSLGDLKINNKVIDKKVNTDEIARWARKMGYDGVIIKNVIDSGPSGRYMPDEAMNPHNVYVAFEPTQIKSVFNKGTWNPDDPRMVQGAGAATAGTGAATMSDKEQK